ncbi:hypothetical protein FRC01_011691 [Tulasnella sp. 417]|nr:hypothetical protein FRC01_011691 [Tulasnella sp. 417]
MPRSPKSNSDVPWTFYRGRTLPPRSGGDVVGSDLVMESRFYGTLMAADISHDQLECLEPEQWLSADLCTFYCYEVGNAFLEGAPGRAKDLVVLHSMTWDLAQWTTKYPLKIRVPGAPPVLDHKYIAFPGNDSGTHFFLCIIVNASDLLQEINPQGPVRTMALILNSSHDVQPKDVDLKIQRIVACLAEGRPLREKELSNITVYQPRVIQQPNGYDCGLYPGHFLRVFLGAPDAYIAHCTGQTLIEGSAESVWEHERVKRARRHLKSLVFSYMEIRQAALIFNSDLPRSGHN